MGEYFWIGITDAIYFTELYDLESIFCFIFSEHGENGIDFLLTDRDKNITIFTCSQRDIFDRRMRGEYIGCFFF